MTSGARHSTRRTLTRLGMEPSPVRSSWEGACAAPTALRNVFRPAYPALTHWANLCRTYGAQETAADHDAPGFVFLHGGQQCRQRDVIPRALWPEEPASHPVLAPEARNTLAQRVSAGYAKPKNA
jgi:hypothetical protein